MPTTRQLRDVYRYPGFEPLAGVRGFHGDPRAVIVTLQRRRKKRLAGFVGKRFPPITIKGLAKSATFLVATSASISRSPSAGSCAGGVGP